MFPSKFAGGHQLGNPSRAVARHNRCVSDAWAQECISIIGHPTCGRPINFGEPLFQPVSRQNDADIHRGFRLKSSAVNAEIERIPFRPLGGEWQRPIKPANSQPTNCISIRAEHFSRSELAEKSTESAYSGNLPGVKSTTGSSYDCGSRFA